MSASKQTPYLLLLPTLCHDWWPADLLHDASVTSCIILVLFNIRKIGLLIPKGHSALHTMITVPPFYRDLTACAMKPLQMVPPESHGVAALQMTKRGPCYPIAHWTPLPIVSILHQRQAINAGLQYKYKIAGTAPIYLKCSFMPSDSVPPESFFGVASHVNLDNSHLHFQFWMSILTCKLLWGKNFS